MEHIARLVGSLLVVMFEITYLACSVIIGLVLGLLLIPKVALSALLKEDRVSQDVNPLMEAWRKLEP